MEPIVAIVLIIGLAWGVSQLEGGDSDDHNKRNIIMCVAAYCDFIVIEEEDTDPTDEPSKEDTK